MAVIAVAGGTGNVGRTIVEALVATGKYDVKIISRKTWGMLTRFEGQPRNRAKARSHHHPRRYTLWIDITDVAVWHHSSPIRHQGSQLKVESCPAISRAPFRTYCPLGNKEKQSVFRNLPRSARSPTRPLRQSKPKFMRYGITFNSWFPKHLPVQRVRQEMLAKAVSGQGDAPASASPKSASPLRSPSFHGVMSPRGAYC
ncbi:hypothetical protein B0J13DRAFT_532541 [Dactylonectria estremocensis]|uniref:NmrA-like domain-containing protein n=1 Tax=Dactylonectria estremocensis TaxID=1079267 RepID=A0A9P9IHE8_9HYPO|nr:hypothetical protein B0J13DRAFT_532541 [Dactylonectria estremocensis]